MCLVDTRLASAGTRAAGDRARRNTDIATQGDGQVAVLPTGVLGFEFDEDLDNGARPGPALQHQRARRAAAAGLRLDLCLGPGDPSPHLPSGAQRCARVYVASYHAPAGHYAFTLEAFSTSGLDNAPIHFPVDVVADPNGVFHYGPGGIFPTDTFKSAYYWVDVVFQDDLDGDGYGPPQDCNDNDPTVHPGAAEVCNGVDDDCDNVIDGPAAAAACDDGDACTTDACDGSGQCVHVPIADCGTTTTTTIPPPTTTTAPPTTTTSSTPLVNTTTRFRGRSR